MNSYFPSVLGSDRLRRAIGEEIRRGTFLHATILEAPEGAGKYEFARAIAAALACRHREDLAAPLPCGECESCKKILSNNCIDVITLSAEGAATLKIQAIRDLKKNIILAPSELDIKVYLIRDADKMTAEAQNALLKMLEEPPVPGTYYLLLAANAETLLPTVRSRAPVLRLSPPSRAELVERLLCEKRTADRDAACRAAAAAGNSPALAREILAATDAGKEMLADYETAEKAVQTVASSGSKADFILFFTALNLKKQDASEMFRLIYCAFRDIITCKRSAAVEPDFYPTAADARRAASGFTLRTALRLASAAEKAQIALDRNTMPKTVMLAFAAEAHNATHSR